jgi:hypothetical protein
LGIAGEAFAAFLLLRQSRQFRANQIKRIKEVQIKTVHILVGNGRFDGRQHDSEKNAALMTHDLMFIV